MKHLKVTVTGFINEIKIGPEDQIQKYLVDLKKRQEIAIGSDVVKSIHKQRRIQGYAGDVDIDPKQYLYPLSIKIEPAPIDNRYF